MAANSNIESVGTIWRHYPQSVAFIEAHCRSNQSSKSGAMSKILKSVHRSAKRLHDAGHMNDLTMREFDALCLDPCPQFTAKDVVRIRTKNRASQSVFAAFLNVGKTTVAAWEQGSKKPSGAASKLLELVDRKGLDVLA